MASILRAATLDGLMHKIVRLYGGRSFELRALPCGEKLIIDRETNEAVHGVKVRQSSDAWTLEARS